MRNSLANLPFASRPVALKIGHRVHRNTRVEGARVTASIPTGCARPTPGLILGPFYPVRPPHDSDHRLWRGSTVPAGARRLTFAGAVLDLAGQPVVGGAVELWHADPAGRYPHPSAPESRLVDPSFLGYGRVTTDALGQFAFDSLVPGGYEAFHARRAIHLHVQITGRCDRLVTQVFLADDATRHDDHWYLAATRREQLVARTLSADAAGLNLEWNAVIARG